MTCPNGGRGQHGNSSFCSHLYSTRLHWDLNPWIWSLEKDKGKDYIFEEFIQENNGSKNEGTGKLQGILNLVDSRDCDGGMAIH